MQRYNDLLSTRSRHVDTLDFNRAEGPSLDDNADAPYQICVTTRSVYSHSCVCFFLFQSPPKGATIPYRPKPQVGGPVILAGGQAYTIQGNYAVPAHSDVSTVLPLPAPAAGPTPPSLNTQTLTTSPFAAHPSSSAFAASHGHPLLSTAHLTTPHHPLHPSPLHASVAGLADPLLKSGHLQAALPPAHLVADAVSLLFFVIRPPPPLPYLFSNRLSATHIYLSPR